METSSSDTAPVPGAAPPKAPARPPFRPTVRWARWALLALIVFTLLRGMLWGLTLPAFFGPDEDYHYFYIETLTVEKRLIAADRPLFPDEYSLMTTAMRYNDYGQSPRSVFEGDPHATTRALANLPRDKRIGKAIGRGVGVVHPPGYQLPAAVVNGALGDSSAFTRVTAVRWYTAFIGALAVWAAWILAAQVLRSEPLRLLVALLVATQPVIAELSGMVNHDQAVIATFTFAVALMLFMLRTQPRARQGAWLGAAIAAGMLVKSSSLALLPLAGATYLGQWLVYRERGREVLKSMGVAGAFLLVLAGWWYVRSNLIYGTTVGTVGEVSLDRQPFQLGQAWAWAKEWTGLTYRTYWFHHFWYEAPRTSIRFYLPAIVGGAGMLGLAGYLLTSFKHVLSREDPRFRQVLLMLMAVLVLYLAFVGVEINHRRDGVYFFMYAGRYLLPAYAAAAVLFVVGIDWLLRDRAKPAAFGAIGLLSLWFCYQTWEENFLLRYYGSAERLGTFPDGGWQEIFRRMSFDRPAIVTPTTLTIMCALIVLSLAAAAILTLYGQGLWPRNWRPRGIALRRPRARHDVRSGAGR